MLLGAEVGLKWVRLDAEMTTEVGEFVKLCVT